MRIETHALLMRLLVDIQIKEGGKDYAEHTAKVRESLSGDKIQQAIADDPSCAKAATQLTEAAVHLLLAADVLLSRKG